MFLRNCLTFSPRKSTLVKRHRKTKSKEEKMGILDIVLKMFRQKLKKLKINYPKSALFPRYTEFIEIMKSAFSIKEQEILLEKSEKLFTNK